MALREVLQFPDPRLKEMSQPIDEISEEIRALAADMCDVMYDEPGIGLAAPQVGVPVRMFVIDTEWTEEGNDRSPMVLINPEIVEKSGNIVYEEGCLSVPDYNADVERASNVTIKAIDLDGKEILEEVEGLRAVCMQHEYDHLDGILFIDRISRLKRSLYVKKRKKQLACEEEE
jgi:peptide deformylase